MVAIKPPLSVYDQSDQSVGEGANKTKDMKTPIPSGLLNQSWRDSHKWQIKIKKKKKKSISSSSASAEKNILKTSCMKCVTF